MSSHEIAGEIISSDVGRLTIENNAFRSRIKELSARVDDLEKVIEGNSAMVDMARSVLEERNCDTLDMEFFLEDAKMARADRDMARLELGKEISLLNMMNQFLMAKVADQEARLACFEVAQRVEKRRT